jgi:hypothetical protein
MARKFMVFLLSEYHARKVVLGTEGRKLARMIHPLNAVSNTYFFVSVSQARKDNVWRDRPADCHG